MRVDGSRIRKEKVVDSKISGYVYTRPKISMENFTQESDLGYKTSLLKSFFNC